jgi:hypothetical protein
LDKAVAEFPQQVFRFFRSEAQTLTNETDNEKLSSNICVKVVAVKQI